MGQEEHCEDQQQTSAECVTPSKDLWSQGCHRHRLQTQHPKVLMRMGLSNTSES